MALPLRYNMRNLLVRKLSTSLTFVVVTAVVFLLAVLLSFADGIGASLANSGDPRNVIVLARGATAESTSIIRVQEASRLVQTPQIALSDQGVPLVSPEVCVQTSIPRLGPEGTLANVAVRGVDDVAFLVHAGVRVTQGRSFEQGALEIIVGKAASERYANLQIGRRLSLGRLGNRDFLITGVFEAGGGALESEIWGPRTVLADAYSRSVVSCALIRTTDEAAAARAITYITGPSVDLDAKTEPEYYRELSTRMREIVMLTMLLVGIMSIGAAFAVANTMFAAVDSRKREIATLRTLGFGRKAIVLSFVLESLTISLAGCLCGLAASFALSGLRQDYLSDTTFTVHAFQMMMTPQIMLAAFCLSVVVGVIGAAAPALRAARTGILAGLRKA